MFRVIGGAVVYGLALYGVVKLFERPDVEVVIQSGGKQGAADITAGEDGRQSDYQFSDASSQAFSPRGST